MNPDRPRPHLRPTAAPPGAPSGDRPADADEAASGEEAPGIRPYLVTAGRARSTDASLRLESQVMTLDVGQAAERVLSFEYREIVELCSQPQSVAEIAALLGLHVGVVRVLVGDLSQQGWVAVHRPPAQVPHDPEIVRRVIDGLRSL